jgi:hypothetical protein
MINFSYTHLINKVIYDFLVSVKPSYKKDTIPDYFNDKTSYLDVFTVFKPYKAGAEVVPGLPTSVIKQFFIEIEHKGIRYKQTSLINEKTAILELLIKLSTQS